MSEASIGNAKRWLQIALKDKRLELSLAFAQAPFVFLMGKIKAGAWI